MSNVTKNTQGWSKKEGELPKKSNNIAIQFKDKARTYLREKKTLPTKLRRNRKNIRSSHNDLQPKKEVEKFNSIFNAHAICLDIKVMIGF